MGTKTLALLLALLPAAALSADYRSSFGFPFSLSGDWLVLTPKEVSKQYEAETLESLRLNLGDQGNARVILEKVKTGKVEFYFDKKYSTRDFTNNISVQLMPGQPAPTPRDVQALCASLARDLQPVHGSSVSVRDCRLAESNGIRYVAYEYLVERTNLTIVQHEIPYLANTTLVIAGGSNAAGLNPLRLAQQDISSSVTKHAAASLRGASTASGVRGKPPSEKEQVALVKETMHKFARSVNAKNFSEFHEFISHLWQREITVHKLNETFRPFMDNNINLLPLDGVTPRFEPAPSVSDNGLLSIKGYYPTKPSRVTFELGYIYESAAWKLVQTKINVRPAQ